MTPQEQEKNLILGFPREIKIKCLKSALEENKIGIFFNLSKILLDTPISEGGLESEVIEKIHQDYINSLTINK